VTLVKESTAIADDDFYAVYFSRDYFVERVEHTVMTTIAPTVFPHVNLGPGKRFASKGAYIVRPQASGLRQRERRF
jgi:hypothetical protein